MNIMNKEATGRQDTVAQSGQGNEVWAEAT